LICSAEKYIVKRSVEPFLKLTEICVAGKIFDKLLALSDLILKFLKLTALPFLIVFVFDCKTPEGVTLMSNVFVIIFPGTSSSVITLVGIFLTP
jgi:hypothetical protein